MVATGCVWNRISNTFGLCKYMLPINCTHPANEDVIISALEWQLYRSLHNIALQLRLSEWTIIEVLCVYELLCNATHGVHICTRCFSPLDVMQMSCLYTVLWGHIQHAQLPPLGMEKFSCNLKIYQACLSSTFGLVLSETLAWAHVTWQADCWVVPWSSGKCFTIMTWRCTPSLS